MVEQSPHGVFLTDREGRCFYVNEAACLITGYSCDELLARSVSDFGVDPDGIEAGRKYFQQVLSQGQATDELRFRHADGSERWWRVEATRIDDDTFMGFTTDVTERRELQKQLDRERQRLARAQEVAGVGWWEVRLETGIVEAAPTTMAIYGVPVGTDVTLDMAQSFAAPEDRPRLNRALADLIAGRAPYDQEFSLDSGDGVRRRVRSLARYDADQQVVFGVLVDISRAAEAQAAMATSEAQLRAIFDSARDYIFLKDLDLRYTHVNPATLDFLGLTQDQVVGCTDADLFPGETAAEIEATDRQVLAGEIDRNLFLRAMDGRQCVLETVKVPVRDACGEVVGLCGVTRDVTEMRRLEEQLRQAQKMEAVGRLAGGVAHDFNNLLTPILGYASLLLDGRADDDPDRLGIEAIERAGARARDLTANLLAFSRKQVLDPQVVSLNELVEDSQVMLRRLLRENVLMRLVLGEDLGLVRADVTQIHNVLINLAVNAVDAMPDGGTLTLETQNVMLDPNYCRDHPEAADGPHVMLAVSDTGFGMDAETRRRAFEPFFTTKPVDEGTGLGLSTVHGIVKQHHGHVEVYSEPNHGATFKIYLPLVSASLLPQAGGRSEPEALRGDEKVLVVEDDEAVRQLAVAVLKTYGYRVTALSSPAAAVALAAGDDHCGYDLLLSDVVMPGMNGAQLHRALLPIWPGLPALFMSGYTSNVIAHHGVLAEGLKFIQKPFTPLDLVRRVREILDGRSDVQAQ